jgi:hypothetical protein
MYLQSIEQYWYDHNCFDTCTFDVIGNMTQEDKQPCAWSLIFLILSTINYALYIGFGQKLMALN